MAGRGFRRLSSRQWIIAAATALPGLAITGLWHLLEDRFYGSVNAFLDNWAPSLIKACVLWTSAHYLALGITLAIALPMATIALIMAYDLVREIGGAEQASTSVSSPAAAELDSVSPSARAHCLVMERDPGRYGKLHQFGLANHGAQIVCNIHIEPIERCGWRLEADDIPILKPRPEQGEIIIWKKTKTGIRQSPGLPNLIADFLRDVWEKELGYRGGGGWISQPVKVSYVTLVEREEREEHFEIRYNLSSDQSHVRVLPGPTEAVAPASPGIGVAESSRDLTLCILVTNETAERLEGCHVDLKNLKIWSARQKVWIVKWPETKLASLVIARTLFPEKAAACALVVRDKNHPRIEGRDAHGRPTSFTLPEPGIYRADLAIEAGGRRREASVFFEWKSNSLPVFVRPPPQ